MAGSSGGASIPPLNEQLPVDCLKAAISELNTLDDLLQAYAPDKLGNIGAHVNGFVGALKRVQESRHHLRGDVPIALIDRVDKESLNPMVYTMEELEKGREGLQGLERKEQAIRVLKDAIVQGVMPPAPPPPPVMMVNGEPPGVPGILPVMNPGGPLPQPGVGVVAPLPVITTEPVAMEVDRPPA